MLKRFLLPWATYAVLLLPGVGYAALAWIEQRASRFFFWALLVMVAGLITAVGLYAGLRWAALSWALLHVIFYALTPRPITAAVAPDELSSHG